MNLPTITAEVQEVGSSVTAGGDDCAFVRLTRADGDVTIEGLTLDEARAFGAHFLQYVTITVTPGE